MDDTFTSTFKPGDLAAIQQPRPLLWVVGPYFLDDRDARIQYTPAWRKFPSDLDFDNTSQASTSAGDSFSLQFEGWRGLVGQGISFYGDINNNSSVNVNASIVIDGRPPLYSTPPIQSEAVTTNNLIYDSGGLSDGNHTLVVTAQNDQAVWVDYFLITPGPPIATPTPTPTPSPTLTPTPTALLAEKSAHVGEIVGPIVAALILVALAVAALFLWRRRHRLALDTPAGSTADALQPVPGSEWMTGPTAVVRQPLLSDANDTPNRPFSASSSHSKFYPVGKHAYN
ncbi:hypothetical protein B0H14DRAFT_2598313 [Mycena olivaceomarginata]|nr:hypothetical protein B0H14DRAFT_2598313 [Mycena olivaceomarginata]